MKTVDYLRKKGLTKEDITLAAFWWDDVNKPLSLEDQPLFFGGGGLGLSLIFGYTPTLNQYSIDLGAPRSFSHHLIGRQEVVKRMERSLGFIGRQFFFFDIFGFFLYTLYACGVFSIY